jgi:methylated-DNA-[protein]-cysteine S-methyltransferase
VGRANATNPIALIVPCHRVIGTNGKLTGYGGGIELKDKLLAWERGIRSKAASAA